MYERILVALDGSELAESALPYVESLAEKYGARVTLLRAVTSLQKLVAESSQIAPVPGPAVTPEAAVEAHDAERDEATRYLEGVAERLRRGGIPVEVATPEEPADQAIIAAAREWPAELIAMTTHGRTGLGRIVYGSVAEAVLRASPSPVLLVRVAEQPEPRHH